MSRWFECPYLDSQIELTDEPLAHIAMRHGELLPFVDRIRDVLHEPEVVRRSDRDPRALLFSRWYDDVRHGKHLAVVVMRGDELVARHWVITAYITNRLPGGTLEWVRH